MFWILHVGIAAKQLEHGSEYLYVDWKHSEMQEGVIRHKLLVTESVYIREQKLDCVGRVDSPPDWIQISTSCSLHVATAVSTVELLATSAPPPEEEPPLFSSFVAPAPKPAAVILGSRLE